MSDLDDATTDVDEAATDVDDVATDVDDDDTRTEPPITIRLRLPSGETADLSLAPSTTARQLSQHACTAAGPGVRTVRLLAGFPPAPLELGHDVAIGATLSHKDTLTVIVVDREPSAAALMAAAAVAAAAPAPAAPAAPGRWLWQSGQHSWTPYPDGVAQELEQAWRRGDAEAAVDAERQVDLRAMRQQRIGAPGRSRAVKREAGDDAAASSSSSSAAAASAGPAVAPAASSAAGSSDSHASKRQRVADAEQPAWRLNTLHPRWRASAAAQAETVGLAWLLAPAELAGATEVHLHNYMIDLDWMVEECPALGAFRGRVRVFYGDGVAPGSDAARGSNWECLYPPHEQFGTHHSKGIVIIRPSLLTVHVTTANFIFSDWNNKTNATWSGHFPRLDAAPAAPADGFGADLLAYYSAVQAIGAAPPPAWRVGGRAGARPPSEQEKQAFARLSLEWVRQYDYAGARARLVASVPGTSAGSAAGRHSGAALHRWGHMRLRELLAAEGLADRFEDSSLVLQFSSLSSVGNDTKWLKELVQSLCGGDGAMPRLRVLFPTRDQVRDSLEGWAAGCSIPCNPENAEKLRARLNELSGQSNLARMCGWDGAGRGVAGAADRAAAVPHIKTYARFNDDGELAWALLSSNNLSQAAWGKLEKNGAQLYVKSYELGVLVLPSLQPPAMRTLTAASSATAASASPSAATIVPLPYSIPPLPYRASDRAWDGNVPNVRDSRGRTPEDAQGVHFYGRGATGRELAERH